MQQFIDEDDTNEQTFKRLLQALRQQDAAKVRDILTNITQDIINQPYNQEMQTPIFIAATARNDQISFALMEMLIQKGALITHRDNNKQSVVFYICRDGKDKCLHLLLSRGITLDEVDLNGQTPLFYVANNDALNIVQNFGSQDMNHRDKLADQTPLFYAARKGYLNMCKALIEKGADPTIVDNMKRSAYDLARRERWVKVAEYLQSEIKKIKEMNRCFTQPISQSLNQDSNFSRIRKRQQNTNTLKNAKTAFKLVFFKQNGDTFDLNAQDVAQLVKSHPQLQQYFTNPDLLPIQKKDRWQKYALKILDQCWKLKGAHWFYQPVDPLKYRIFDYLDKIKKPMDLGSIKKRLKYNFYQRPQQFVQDMTLVWKNCYQYNGQYHQISRYARQIELTFDDYFKTYGFTRYLTK